ncbi:MAG: hypothetical protein LYZ70_02440 [Nitrososphaerales archaeon]|nr:hypothetical protein [Nitrososphaerales archaeon]
MPAKAKTLGEYLRELEKAKKEKPEQVREALGIYLDLWQRAIKKGVVQHEDEVEVALSKIEQSGGLYKAAED